MPDCAGQGHAEKDERYECHRAGLLAAVPDKVRKEKPRERRGLGQQLASGGIANPKNLVYNADFAQKV